MTFAICDCRIPASCASALKAMGFTLLRMPSFSALPAPVSAHPDMLMFRLGDTVYAHANYMEKAAAEQFETLRKAAPSLQLHPVREPVSDKYPHDILFNILKVGRYIFGRISDISATVKLAALDDGCVTCDVSQGYAKCSTVVLTDDAIITADRGIAKAARDCGIDTLVVERGHVLLRGYDTGFIGGASAVFGENVLFTGDITAHPSYPEIEAFCVSHGKKPVSLSVEPLYDVGGIFFVETKTINRSLSENQL